MDTAKPTIIVTGVSGNLGQRLVPQLSDYAVVGVDVTPPTHSPIDRFVPLDLGKEESTRELLLLLRELQPVSLVHLAFVIDPQRSGVLDVDRMWRINVAGTARVIEAITEANRSTGSTIRQFIFPSSVSAYGSDLPAPVAEDSPLGAHTLPYAIHKKESDLVVQQRAPALRASLRPEVSGQQNPVRPRRRHGPADRVDIKAGTGSTAADHPERRGTWRSFDLCAVYRTGARQIAASSWTVGHATRSAVSVELEDLGDSAGRRPLHDRRVHYEHRSAEELSRRRLRPGN